MSSKRSRIDFTSVVGLPVGVGLVILGQALEGGSIRSVIQPTAALIVFGGTLGAVLLSFSLTDVKRACAALKTVFLWNGELPSQTIQTVMKYATHARTSGVLSLEDELPGVSDPFLRKALTLVEQLGFPKERFQVLVNRVDRRTDIGTSDMEKLFGCPVHASLPNDYFSLHRVVTLGQPLGGDGDIALLDYGADASARAHAPVRGRARTQVRPAAGASSTRYISGGSCTQSPCISAPFASNCALQSEHADLASVMPRTCGGVS